MLCFTTAKIIVEILQMRMMLDRSGISGKGRGQDYMQTES